MSLKYKNDGDAGKVIINKDITLADIDPILKDFEKDKSAKDIHIDVTNLYTMGSATLAAFVALRKVALKKGGRATLVNPNEAIIQILEMSDMVDEFHIERDYSVYTPEELIKLFYDDETATDISSFIAINYNDEYKNVIHKYAKSDDPDLKSNAIFTMGRAQDDSSIDLIRAALDSEYPNVAISAALVLGWLGDTQSKDKLYKLLENNDISIDEAAAASIALLSDDTDAVKFKTLSKSSDPKMRSVVAGALALINDELSYNILKDMLKSEKEESVKKLLVTKISLFNKEEVTTTLISYLDDESLAVREAAAAGLARTGLKGHEKALLGKVTSKDTWLGYFTVKALAGGCTVEAAEHLKKVYKTVDENVKLAIVEALGNSVKENSLFITELLKDDNEDIRKEAINALYKLDHNKAVDVAKELLIKDNSWLVRYKSLDIIVTDKPAGYEAILKSALAKDDNRYIREKINSVLGL